MEEEPNIMNISREEDKQKVLSSQSQSDCTGPLIPKESADEAPDEINDKFDNIVKRTRNDTELDEIEKKYQTIFENYAVAITLVDTEERIVSWNKYAEELLNMDEKDLYLRPVSSLYPSEEWQKIRIENVRKKGIKYRMETKMIRKEEGPFDVELSLCVLNSKDGKVVGSVGIIKDITKQKEMEQALKNSEKKFKQLYEKAPVPYHTLSPDGIIIDVNDIWCQTLGYTKDEVIGKSIFDFVEMHERDLAKASFEKKLRSKQLYSLANERSYLTKKSEKRVFVIRDYFSFDDDNNVTAVYTIMDDVTELKKAEEELKKTELVRESAQRLQTVIDTVEEGITLSDTEGHFEIFNSKMHEITGYTIEDANNSGDFTVLLYPDMQERKKALDTISKTIKEGVSKNFETTIQTKDGAKKTLLVSTSLTKIDNRDMFLSVYRDITERKKAEEALQKSENRYRASIELTQLLAWTTSGNGEIVEDIPTWRKFTGQSYEDVKGSGWVKAIHPEDLERTIRIWTKAVETKSTYETEYRLRRFDGVYRTLLARGIPILKEEGEIKEWVGICIDITNRKIAEEELKKKIDELERFENFTVDRELMMVELKKETNELCKKLGEKPRYDIDKEGGKK
ncbi:MAG: PAS domain S-box protein [Methanobacteriota archaeon]